MFLFGMPSRCEIEILEPALQYLLFIDHGRSPFRSKRDSSLNHASFNIRRRGRCRIYKRSYSNTSFNHPNGLKT